MKATNIWNLCQEYKEWLVIEDKSGLDCSIQINEIYNQIGEKIGLGADYAKQQLEEDVLKPYRKYMEELKEQMAADDEKIWTKAKAKLATLLYWPRLELTTLARDYQYSMMEVETPTNATLKRLIEQGLGAKYGHTGIYSISIGDKLVYIGKSRDMLQRLAQHIDAIGTDPSNKYKVLQKAREEGYKIQFDVMRYCEIDNDDELGEAEAELINKHMPPLNYQIPKIGDYKHFTVNKKAKYITLAEILDPAAETFIF